MYDLELYLGKGTEVTNELGNDVVTSFARHLKQGTSVFMDNFYTNLALFELLKEKMISATGIVKCNRVGNPDEIKSFNRRTKANEKSPISMKSDTDVLAIAWIDKRPVTMLTSDSSNAMILKEVRDKNGKSTIRKPKAIDTYNNKMNGIDRSDQIVASKHFARKSLKWLKKLFFHL